MRNRIIALLLCAGMLLLGGCSDHSSSSAGSATIEPDVEDFASETVETPPVSSEAPKDALDGYSGLVIGRWYVEHIDGSLSNGTHYTISLDCLDVDSGEVRNISEFNFDVKSITYQTSTGGWSAEHDFRFESFPIVLCAPAEGFNASYDKMVFDKRVQEREYTAGWIDCEGNFFDVTGTLGLEPKNEYGFTAMGFVGDYFCFGDAGYSSTYYVPISDLRAENVVEGFPRETRIANATWFGEDYALVELLDPEIDGKSVYIYDVEAMRNTKLVSDAFIQSHSGVVSPDGAQIALLGRNSDDAPFDIYIVDSDNFSNARKVSMPEGADILFDKSYSSTPSSAAKDEGLVFCGLLAWI